MKPTYFRTALAGVAAVALTTTGCHRAQPAGSLEGVTLAWQLTPQPPHEGKETVTVDLTGPAKKPLTGATVKIEGNMSHAGMKPVFGDGKEVKPGRYEVPLEFTMGGDWFLLIDVKLADGRSMTRKVDVPAVRGD
jgi:hypothetical protein